MNLINQIITRLSVVLLVIFTLWAIAFYFIIIDEINDETDDSLEDYSEYIIRRFLGGDSLPSTDNGTNNSYFIRAVTPEYARSTDNIRYSDEMIYLKDKGETEPGRILKTIFKAEKENFYELTVTIPTIEKEDLKETILTWIIALYLFLLVTILITNAWIIRKCFKPLYNLLDWLNSYEIGKIMPPLENNSGIPEFRILNQTILHSVKRTEEAYEQQKTFIGNASHELQTPLAVCKNRLEMIMEEHLSEGQMRELAKVQHTLEHAIKLNKTLLLLSKIDNRQFPEEKEIHINALVRELLGTYGEIYGYKNLSVNVHEKSQCMIHMNPELASTLFNNLIKNAFVHTEPGGDIDILISSGIVEISNTGENSALDPQKIFKRFYQGSKKENSTGLGLSLVDSIATLYGFTVTYKFSSQKHYFVCEM